MLSFYERGVAQMPDEIKIRLARYFNVSLDYLYGLIDEQIGYMHDSILYVPKCLTNEALEKAKHYIGLLELEIENKK